MRQNITNKSDFYLAIFYWFLAGFITILISISTIGNPVTSLTWFSIFFLTLLTFKNIKLGLYIIIFLPVAGELIRIQAGPAGPVILSDIAIPIFLIIWFIKLLHDHIPTQKINLPPLIKPIAAFIFIAALSLIAALTFLTPQEVFSGSLYLIRFATYIFLYFATWHILQKDTTKNPPASSRLLSTITAAALLIAIAGFIQLIIFPDLTALEKLGWDPHINRLVSTWLDPNFIGGFLAFIIVILTGITLYLKNNKHKIANTAIILILTTALFLTYSRSAYLALAAGFLVITLIKSRKLLLIIIIIATLGISISDRAQQRTAELMQSATSIITPSAQIPDPTARLRIQSWQQTWYIFEKYPILGSGYNTLRTINHKEGFVKATDNHSASGSDSSLLTILATTGIAGFIAFFIIYLTLALKCIQVLRSKKETKKGLALGFLASLAALFIHSFFVNSLLFPPIMIYFWITAAILTNSLNSKT